MSQIGKLCAPASARPKCVFFRGRLLVVVHSERGLGPPRRDSAPCRNRHLRRRPARGHCARAGAFNDDFSIATFFITAIAICLPPTSSRSLVRAGRLAAFLVAAAGGIRIRSPPALQDRSALFAYASVIIASVQVFFLLILNFAAHPFAIMEGALPADGTGLNPLLQYPEMVIHPPMLYLGYVGFTVPFAFALGALIMKYPVKSGFTSRAAGRW